MIPPQSMTALERHFCTLMIVGCDLRALAEAAWREESLLPSVGPWRNKDPDENPWKALLGLFGHYLGH